MDISRNIIKRLRENRILQEKEEYSEKDHKELVDLAKNGDQLAVETLINEYKPAIENIASKFILDSGDKEDVRQIATIGFWEAIQSWSGDGSFGSYANMIMNRKLTDELRKDSAGKALINSQASSLDEPVAGDEDGASSVGDSMPSTDLSPEDDYIGRAGEAELVKFMREKLSDIEREAINMYVDGYKVSEIAEETGMPYKKIENAIKRVKDKLADFLRARESKKIREAKGLEFSDEEKKLLKKVLKKIND